MDAQLTVKAAHQSDCGEECELHPFLRSAGFKLCSGHTIVPSMSLINLVLQ